MEYVTASGLQVMAPGARWLGLDPVSFKGESSMNTTLLYTATTTGLLVWAFAWIAVTF